MTDKVRFWRAEVVISECMLKNTAETRLHQVYFSSKVRVGDGFVKGHGIEDLEVGEKMEDHVVIFGLCCWSSSANVRRLLSLALDHNCSHGMESTQRDALASRTCHLVRSAEPIARLVRAEAASMRSRRAR